MLKLMRSLVKKGDTTGTDAQGAPQAHFVDRDIDLILWSIRLHNVRRYFHQRFWERETQAAEFASKIEGFPRLESVAEHSWHVAFVANFLVDRFPALNMQTVLQLCILHDVLEIVTGDRSPIGRDGTGFKTHAFNEAIARQRAESEELAIVTYTDLLSSELGQQHRELLRDYVWARTSEACFVKSVDKLQSLAYVFCKKDGEMEDKHVRFTLQYTEKGISHFPALEDHFRTLQGRLIRKVAKFREVSEPELRDQLFGSQLSFW